MRRKIACLLSAGAILGMVSIVGPVQPASAQVPAVGSVRDLLTSLTSAVSDLIPIGPGVFADVDTTESAFVYPGDYGSEAILVNGITVNCSGLFLPIQGLDGPITVDVTVTQTIDEVVTIGYQRMPTPYCDGFDETYSVTVPVNAGSLVGFFTGTAVVSVDMRACDITGCNFWTTAGSVFVED